MIKRLFNPQWIYNLVKYSSATLFGVALAGTLPLSSVRAQSITPANDGTGTVVNQSDNTFDITGGTQADGNLFHSFEQLGLDANEVANILSGSDVNNILGRVVGGNASIIDGLLQVTGSNANLFLMNPAGIIFGPEAQVLVPGAFTATTANGIQLGEAWFNALGSNDYTTLLGDPSGFAFSSDAPGVVINVGSLVSPGESVTLLGGVVVNTGTIETPGGTINIAAVPGENRVDITPEGSLLTLALPADARAGLNAPSQGFTASDLPALLSGEAVGNRLGVVVDGGVVTLVATDTVIPTEAGTAIASGTLEASDVSANGVGGGIDVLGDRVGILNATLNASGTTGGGNIRIGGDYQGNGPVANAERTYISESSTVAADGTENGDGGRVIVWADGLTAFAGEISAQGGLESGDGGFVEVSGAASLSFDGTVNTAATNGESGQLLLDPDNVEICEATCSPGAVVAPANALDVTGILTTNGPGGLLSISPRRIETVLENGSVTVAADNNITVKDRIFANFGGTNSLTLSATDISINDSIEVPGSLILVGTNSIDISTKIPARLDITSNGGSLQFRGALEGESGITGDINITADTDQTVSLRSRSVQGNSERGINLVGNNVGLTSTDGTIALETPFERDPNSNIALTASNNLSVEGQSIALDTGAGGISLRAGNDITLRGDGNIPVAKDATISLQTVGNTIFSGDNVTLDSTGGAVLIESLNETTLQANDTLTVTDGAGADQQAQILSRGNMLLQGNDIVSINALGSTRSVVASGGNIDLRSNNTITGNGRFFAGDNVTFSTVSGAPGSFTADSPTSSAGIISADGNVRFGAYEGPSLKIEATGSITGGDISINNVNSELMGSDPDVGLLSNSSSVVIRAGILPFQPPTQPTVNRLPDRNQIQNASSITPSFMSSVVTDAPDTPGNITIGNIDTTISGEGGTVILNAPGNITTGHITTGLSNSASSSTRVSDELVIDAGGSISIAGGNSVGTLSSLFSRNGLSILADDLSVRLNAGENIVLDGGIENTPDPGGPGVVESFTSVLLAAKTGDIQIGYIETGAGGVNISAGGSFRAVDSFEDTFTSETFPFPSEFTDFLNESGISSSSVTLDGARRVSILVQFNEDELRTNENALPVIPITIRYGDGTQPFPIPSSQLLGGNTTLQYQVVGDSDAPFVVGPVFEDGITFVSAPSDPFAPSDLLAFRVNDSRGLTQNEFPEGASGLSGGIAVRTNSNTVLFGGLQNQTFGGDDGGGDNHERNETVLNETETVLADRNTLCEDDTASDNGDDLLIVDEALLPEGTNLSEISQEANDCNKEEDEAADV